MKIKYLSGKKANTVIEIDDVQAKGLIEDGIAEAVAEAGIAIADDFVKALDSRDEALRAEFAKSLDERDAKIGKAVAKSRPTIVVGADRVDSDPQAGFKGIGDYLNTVVRASKGMVDPRLERLNKTVSPQNETTAADGGNVVPVQYADFLYNDILNDEDGLLARSSQFPSTTNSLKIGCDNTTTLGQSGIVAAVVGEGVSISDTKAAIRQLTFNVRKLATLVDVTEELLADTNVALPAYLSMKSKYAFDWKINHDFLLGNASGNSTDVADGVIGHAATVVVNYDGDTGLTQITYGDLCNMRKQFYGDRSKAVWIMGPDVEADVMQVQDGAGRNIYFPPGGLANQPYGTLFGIPVVISYHTPAVGTVGDIILADWSKYFVVTRGGVDSASTPFLHWDQQLMSFRTTFRLIGRPERSAVLATPAGYNVSPFVTLESRT